MQLKCFFYPVFVMPNNVVNFSIAQNKKGMYSLVNCGIFSIDILPVLLSVQIMRKKYTNYISQYQH